MDIGMHFVLFSILWIELFQIENEWVKIWHLFCFIFYVQADEVEAVLANTKQVLNQFLRKSSILFIYQTIS